MKKHIITLNALILGVSTICLVGCGGGEDFTPSTNDQEGVEISDEKDKADAEKQGYNAGPPGGRPSCASDFGQRCAHRGRAAH